MYSFLDWVKLFFFIILPCGIFTGLIRYVLAHYMSKSRYCDAIVTVVTVIISVGSLFALLEFYRWLG